MAMTNLLYCEWFAEEDKREAYGESLATGGDGNSQKCSMKGY